MAFVFRRLRPVVSGLLLVSKRPTLSTDLRRLDSMSGPVRHIDDHGPGATPTRNAVSLSPPVPFTGRCPVGWVHERHKSVKACQSSAPRSAYAVARAPSGLGCCLGTRALWPGPRRSTPALVRRRKHQRTPEWRLVVSTERFGRRARIRAPIPVIHQSPGWTEWTGAST